MIDRRFGDNYDMLLGQILSRLESLDGHVEEIKQQMERREQRLRNLEDEILKVKAWAAGIGLLAALVGQILANGVLKKLVALLG